MNQRPAMPPKSASGGARVPNHNEQFSLTALLIGFVICHIKLLVIRTQPDWIFP
jgi:hypothetical protein